MAQITYADKATGDTFAATEATLIKTVVNANDTSTAAHIANAANPHGVTKAQVGLGNVDNTADTAKPVSTAQAAADATKQPILQAITAPITAATLTLSQANNFWLIDTTSNAVAITLPPSPVDNDELEFKIVTLGAFNATVTCNTGQLFNTAGGATALTMILLNEVVRLKYKAGIWIVANSNALSQLDLRYLQPFANQNANTFYRGPVSGAAAAATFGVLTTADLPAVTTPATNITPVVAGDGYQTAVDKLQSQATSALANAGNPLQAETAIYINRVKAKSNTYIDSVTVQAIDRFFVIGKADGWLPLMKWVWCPMSSTLAGALVNLYNASGVPNEVVNNNFVTADYDPKIGLGVGAVANPNKTLTTGFIPTNVGLTNSNVTVGVQVSDDLNFTNPGFYLAFNTSYASNVNPAIYINSSPIALGQIDTSSGASIVSNIQPCIVQGSWGPSNQFVGFNNGDNAVNSNTTVVAARPLDQVVTLFNSTTYGTNASGKLGMAYIGSFMTLAQNKSLIDASKNLLIAIGRLNDKGSIALFEGDSITNGAGSSTAANRWASLVAGKISHRELNWGIGSSKLRKDVTASGNDAGIVGVINRYKNISTSFINTVFIMIGTNDLIDDGTSTGDPTAINDYKTKYTTVLNYYLAQRYSVIVCGIPYNAVTTTYTPAVRNAYQLAGYQAASALSLPFVDCEFCFSDLTSPNSYFPDTVHPNPAGHAIIANQVIEVYRGRTSRTPLMSFPTIAVGASADLTFTMYGARTNMSAILGEPTTDNPDIIYKVFVSADNTITVRARNVGIAAVSLSSMYMKITLILSN